MNVTEVEDMELLRIFCKNHAAKDLKTANLTAEITAALQSHCERFCKRSFNRKLFIPPQMLGKRIVGVVGDRVRSVPAEQDAPSQNAE